MRKILVFPVALLFAVILLNFSSAIYQENMSSNSTSTFMGVSVSQLAYDPYPVSPGNYFDFYIKATQISGSSRNATFKFYPNYPFSIDSNENQIKSFGPLSSSDSVLVHYKARVDENAIEGPNQLKIQYDSNGGLGENWITQSFDIYVTNPKTDFDAVVQDSSTNQISIAVANTGTNTANSLIVKVPDQSVYRVSGTNAQMVGNLASGDYSIVSFTLQPATTMTGLNRTGNFAQNRSGGLSGNRSLSLELDYTDNIGIRRSVIKAVPLNLQQGNSTSLRSLSGRTQTGTSTSSIAGVFTNIWFWLFVAAAIIAGVFYKKNKNLNKSSGKRKNSDIPEWMNSEKTSKRK